MARIMHDDNFYYDVVRKNIKKYRLEKGLTQQKLADLCELSMDYIAEIESLKKKKGFSISTIGRIADSLEIEITELFKQDEHL